MLSGAKGQEVQCAPVLRTLVAHIRREQRLFDTQLSRCTDLLTV